MSDIVNIKNLDELDAEYVLICKDADDIFNDIKFNNISFAYDEEQVIRNISLVAKEKETIALVGESGSGKSTLLKLVSGLISPTSGDILFNIQLKKLRQHLYNFQF